MTDAERLVWLTIYASATLTKEQHPDTLATIAVVHYRQAEYRFGNDFPTPPED